MTLGSTIWKSRRLLTWHFEPRNFYVRMFSADTIRSQCAETIETITVHIYNLVQWLMTAVDYLGEPQWFPSRLRFDRGLVLLILSRFPKNFWLHELHAGVQRIAHRISWLFEAKNRNAKAVNRPRFLWFHREKSPSKLYRSTGSNNPNYLILEFADLE